MMNPFILRLLCGVAIGVGFVLPGVSGGVMAVSMGLYERMLSALRHFFEHIRENFRFLLPIGIGGVIGVLLTSNVLKVFIERYEAETLALFCGFVIGSLPILYEETKTRPGQKLRVRDVAAALAGFGLVLLLQLLDTSATAQQGMSAAIPPLLALLSGGVLAIGVAIPGVSSSFLLVYLGLYKPILLAIADVYLPTLFFAGVGFAIAGVLLIVAVNALLRKFHTLSYFAILGIAAGSVLLIVPGVIADFSWVCILTLAIGLGLGILQSAVQIRRTRRERGEKEKQAETPPEPLETSAQA